jgi:hypothetical protein
MRSTCSECGGPIAWLTPEQVQQDREVSQDVARAEKFLGERVTSVWRCGTPTCGEIGFFGATFFG